MSAYRSRVQVSEFHPETRSFFKGKVVSVPGGGGFIGSHVVEQLVELGARVIVPARTKRPRFLESVFREVEMRRADLLNAADAERAVAGAEVVLNLAADVGGIAYNKAHPGSIFRRNLLVFLNVLEAARAAEVARFLVTSSACVYPRHCSIPTREEEGLIDEPEPTNAGYGWAKRMEEFVGKSYAQEFGMSVAIARPYNAYGPRDNFDPATSHVIPALMRKAWLATDGTFEVWGDGSHSRSFLYVDDFARGLLEVTARYPVADPINIGAAEEITISEVTDKIALLVSQRRGQSIEPRFRPEDLTGQPRRMCDTSKLERVLGYRTHVPLDKGLEQTLNWYVEHENNPVPVDAQ